MLCVSWGQHESQLLSHLLRYFSGEAFVDVTLWCAGRRFKAHRIMLSACSAYLERVLLEHPGCGGEPVSLVVHGVEAEQLRRLLELMYRGRTTVSAGDLPTLLDTASALGVRLLHSTALRVVAADAPHKPHCGHLDMETSYPSKKGVETAKLVTMDSIPLSAAVSPIRQLVESQHDAPKADKPEGPVATLPPVAPTLPHPPSPQPSPPSAPPTSTQPPLANNPHVLLPGAPTAPPQQPSTVDWPHFPLLTHPLGAWFPDVQQRPEPPPADLGVGMQIRGQMDAGCDSDYSLPAKIHKLDAPIPTAIGPPDISHHHVAPVTMPHGTIVHNPHASQAEKANGSWVKTDDHCDSVHRPSQPRLAWEMQPCSIPLQQQVKLKDGTMPAEAPTREGQSAGDPQQQKPLPQPQPQYACLGPLDNCPGYEAQTLPLLQTPPWSPKSGGAAAKKLDDVWLMDQHQPPAQTSSPARVFTELLPPKSTSQPTIITSITVSSTAGEQQGLNNEHNVRPAYVGSDGSPLQTQQSSLPNNQQQQFFQENTPEETTKTESKNGKENVCETCNKTFATRFSLTVHVRTHRGEKPYECSLCGRRFSQRRNLRYHLSLHSGSREFAAACPVCGKEVSDRGYLSSHMKIHRDRREYGCAHCGRRFNQRVAYNTHVRTHTGERPHSCALCPRAFTRKVLLNRHMRKHTGQQPLLCQVCGKHFWERSRLELHARSHVCAQCGCGPSQQRHLCSCTACHAPTDTCVPSQQTLAQRTDTLTTTSMAPPPPMAAPTATNLLPMVALTATNLPAPSPQPPPPLSLPYYNITAE